MPDDRIFQPIVHRYYEKDPMEAAHQLESMLEEEALTVYNSLPPELAARVFPHLQDHYAASLLRNLPPETVAAIADKLEAQKGATIFRHLSQEQRQAMLEKLPPKLKKDIQELLTFPKDSAGQIMSTDVLAFHTDMTVDDAVRKIRGSVQKKGPASYVYVVDQSHRLCGVINMRDLMLASGGETLGQVMRTGVFTVNSFMDREAVATELSKRKYFAVPVVDSENRLLGIVKAESIIKDVKEEATEDIQKMFGAGGDERVFSPMRYSLVKRLPWLHVNLATAFLAASVVALFEGIIAKITALAIFLPVVAGQGGNAGAQSLAVVMRGLVMREIPANKVRPLILKETWIGVVNGVVIGIVTAVIAWIWQRSPFMGLVIGLGMVVNLTIAGLAGAAIPLTMKGLGLDPAQCSNIILTTVTDVMGFFAFLGFAVIFQSYLI